MSMANIFSKGVLSKFGVFLSLNFSFSSNVDFIPNSLHLWYPDIFPIFFNQFWSCSNQNSSKFDLKNRENIRIPEK